MIDDLKDKGPRDRSTISLTENWEVSWWTQSFGVSKEQLEEAIRKVGNSVDKVREYFMKK